MLARISAPLDYTATQFQKRMSWPSVWLEEITEPEGQFICPSIEIPPGSMIGLWSTFGDITVGFRRSQPPTQASFTVNSLCSAPLVVTTFSNTQASVIANVLDLPLGLSHKEFFFATAIGSARGVQHSAIEAAIGQIEEFRSRTDGWKGPNSLGPTGRKIDDAKTFAAVVLEDSKVEPPHIGLAADGEITFFWQNPKITIDLTIAGEGTYAYFAKPDAGMPFFEDAAPVTENFPEKILSLIRRAA